MRCKQLKTTRDRKKNVYKPSISEDVKQNIHIVLQYRVDCFYSKHSSAD